MTADDYPLGLHVWGDHIAEQFHDPLVQGVFGSPIEEEGVLVIGPTDLLERIARRADDSPEPEGKPPPVRLLPLSLGFDLLIEQILDFDPAYSLADVSDGTETASLTRPQVSQLVLELCDSVQVDGRVALKLPIWFFIASEAATARDGMLQRGGVHYIIHEPLASGEKQHLVLFSRGERSIGGSTEIAAPAWGEASYEEWASGFDYPDDESDEWFKRVHLVPGREWRASALDHPGGEVPSPKRLLDDPRSRAERMVRKIEDVLAGIVSKVLKEKHGDDWRWWVDGIPRTIRVDAARRREEDEVTPLRGKRLPLEAYLNFIHFKEIIGAKKGQFNEVFAAAKLDKATLLNELLQANDIRNRVVHRRGSFDPVDQGELEFLEELERRVEQLAAAAKTS